MWGRARKRERPTTRRLPQGAQPLGRGSKGVSPEVFWNIAGKHGIKVPKPLPVTV
jgi:hypothetical protein